MDIRNLDLGGVDGRHAYLLLRSEAGALLPPGLLQQLQQPEKKRTPSGSRNANSKAKASNPNLPRKRAGIGGWAGDEEASDGPGSRRWTSQWTTSPLPHPGDGAAASAAARRSPLASPLLTSPFRRQVRRFGFTCLSGRSESETPRRVRLGLVGSEEAVPTHSITTVRCLSSQG
jgi:hypothetical protein